MLQISLNAFYYIKHLNDRNDLEIRNLCIRILWSIIFSFRI